MLKLSAVGVLTTNGIANMLGIAMTEWTKQAWRTDPRNVCLETDVGTFTVSWNGGTGWHLGWLNSYLEGNITIDPCMPTDTIARNTAEYIAMSRRTWYTLNHPGGQTPIEQLSQAGYIVDMCPDAPNYAWVYPKPRSDQQHTDANKYLCYDAMKKFLDITLIVTDYKGAPKPIEQAPVQLPPSPWSKPVAPATPQSGWMQAKPALPTGGWKR